MDKRAREARYGPRWEVTLFAVFTDVDDLKRAQQRLAERDALIHESLSHVDAQYWIYYLEQHRYEILVPSEKYLGIPLAMDGLPDSFIEYIHMPAKDQPKYRRIYDEIDQGADAAECDVRFEFRGSVSWFRVRLAIIPVQDGQARRAIGSARDITDFKSAEESLLREELRRQTYGLSVLLGASFNLTQNRVLEYDGEHIGVPKLPEGATVDYVTEQAAQLIDGEEAQAEFLRRFSTSCLLDAYRHGTTEVSFDYRRKLGDSVRWVTLLHRMVPDPTTGDVISFIYMRDIDAAKRDEIAVQHIVASSFEYAVVVDLKTRLEHVIEAGDGFERYRWLEGKSYDDLRRLRVPAAVHPDDCEAALKCYDLDNVLAHLENEKMYTFSYRLKELAENLPGSPNKQTTVEASYLDDRRDALIFCITDHTELFLHEQQQRVVLEKAVADANVANAAKADFLSRMSHDIRTPLNGIIGMTALAKGEDMAPAARGYLDKIDISSHFLLSLVNDILDMSKIDSGKMELHPEPYDEREFLDYIGSVISPLCIEKGIRFESPKLVGSGLAVVVDKLRYNQIFFNLLSNAVKFTPSGGEISLSGENVSMEDGCLDGDFVVRDNGIGMSEEFQKKLFSPFEQEGTGRSDAREGSGLGLAITKSLVEAMGGAISVKSAPGQGSEFRVHLRLKTASARPAENRAAEDASKALLGKRILLVEDNDINAEIAEVLLEGKGIIFERASNGQEALDKADASEPGFYDAILMDVRMPVMDGIEATKAIRALGRPDAKTVPIIAMTANAFDEDVRQCIEAGMDSHISKPIEPAAFFSTLASCLRKTS